MRVFIVVFCFIGMLLVGVWGLAGARAEMKARFEIYKQILDDLLEGKINGDART